MLAGKASKAGRLTRNAPRVVGGLSSSGVDRASSASLEIRLGPPSPAPAGLRTENGTACSGIVAATRVPAPTVLSR
jgi:hypothetical protein